MSSVVELSVRRTLWSPEQRNELRVEYSRGVHNFNMDLPYFPTVTSDGVVPDGWRELPSSQSEFLSLWLQSGWSATQITIYRKSICFAAFLFSRQNILMLIDVHFFYCNGFYYCIISEVLVMVFVLDDFPFL